ncbi:MAG: hypothetical protein PV344_02750 [Anaplasma sp.]|nr:hypothetical protein [Anaplasma sp.]
MTSRGNFKEPTTLTLPACSLEAIFYFINAKALTSSCRRKSGVGGVTRKFSIGR